MAEDEAAWQQQKIQQEAATRRRLDEEAAIAARHASETSMAATQMRAEESALTARQREDQAVRDRLKRWEEEEANRQYAAEQDALRPNKKCWTPRQQHEIDAIVANEAQLRLQKQGQLRQQAVQLGIESGLLASGVDIRVSRDVQELIHSGKRSVSPVRICITPR